MFINKPIAMHPTISVILIVSCNNISKVVILYSCDTHIWQDISLHNNI